MHLQKIRLIRWVLFYACAVARLGTAVQASQPLSQDEAVAEALRLNPAVTAARQHVTEAQGHVAEMEGGKKFQLSLEGTLSESNGRVAEPPSIQSFEAAEASLIAPIPNVGRSNAQVDQARQQLLAAQAQFHRATLDVEFRTSEAFVELWRAREGRDIAQQNLDQSVRQAADTQKRIDAGDVPAADLLKAQVQVAQNRAALARAKIAVSVANQNLNDLLQRELDAPLDLATPAVVQPAAITSDQAVAAALAHSPDIVEAQADFDAARANTRFVRHSRDFDFSLGLTHSRTSDITAYSYLTTFGLTVSFPILDGGAAAQQVKQAIFQANQAETALKQARQEVRLAVEQALLDVQGDEANASATAATEEIARQSSEKARQSYDAGLTTTRDVLDAQLVYSQSRVDANSARYDLAIARAKLKQLMGGELP